MSFVVHVACNQQPVLPYEAASGQYSPVTLRYFLTFLINMKPAVVVFLRNAFADFPGLNDLPASKSVQISHFETWR